MLFFDQYKTVLPDYAGEEVNLAYYRDGKADTLTFTLPESGRLDVYNTTTQYSNTTRSRTRNTTLLQPSGADEVAAKLDGYIRQFKLIFNPKTEAYKEVGGFLTILQQYEKAWDWRHFWEFTAFLSIMLGFLNILPIPALDGGHVVFTVIEMITG